MKFLLDFFPVAAFFIAFYIPADRADGIYLATAAAIAAGFIQMAVCWLLTRRFETMHLVTLAILIALGSATLLLHDERFIKWKPTVVYWLFAAVLLGGQLLMRTNIIQRMMEHAVELPQAIWNNLNLGWALFFLLSGLANLYIAFAFSDEVWVNFKLFGILGLTLLFAIAQGAYIYRHMPDPDNEEQM